MLQSVAGIVKLCKLALVTDRIQHFTSDCDQSVSSFDTLDVYRLISSFGTMDVYQSVVWHLKLVLRPMMQFLLPLVLGMADAKHCIAFVCGAFGFFLACVSINQ